MDEDKIKQITREIESEWQMGGFADTIYSDFALEVTKRYCSQQKTELVEKMKVLLSEIVEKEGYQEMADGADQMIHLASNFFDK